MLNSLLQTKLHIPATRPVLVERPRLLKALNDGLAGKLALISAPAGFGKSTLAAEWLSTLAVTDCWLSLDEDDNDPQRFFSYIAQALSPVPGLGRSLPGILASAQPASPQTLASALINDVTAVVDRLVLVLDDYQAINYDAIHKAVDLVLEYMPPQMHLLITSRTDPLLSLSRLRARGQITEIRTDDLRFTAGEAQAFLHQVMGLDLAAGEVDTLEKRTEGWVAGLQMAALSMQRMESEGQIKAFVEAFAGSHRYIFDYLTDEVLEHQPADIRDFLLQTSILDRLCGPLCDAVLGSSDGADQDSAAEQGSDNPRSQSILEQLDQANLFIVPLDDQRVWFRYHHLFAQLLRQRLRQAKAALVPILYERASTWHEAQGDSESAIQYALTGGNPKLATRLLDKVAMRYVNDGDIVTLRSLVESLPDQTWDEYPRLILAYAWTLLFSFELDAIEAILARAESHLARPGSLSADHSVGLSAGFSADHLAASIAALRAYRAGWSNEPEESIVLSQEALAILEPINDQEIDYLRGTLTLNLAISQKAVRRLAEAEDNLQKAVTLNCASGRVYAASASFSSLMVLYIEQGRLFSAEAWGQRGLDWITALAQETGRVYPTEAMIRLNAGRVLYEWNRLSEAYTHIDRSLDLVKSASPSVLYIYGYYLFLLQLAQDDLAQALATYERIGRSVTADDLPDRVTAAMTMAEMAVRSSYLDSGERQWPAELESWVSLAGIQAGDAFDYSEATNYRHLAWVLIAIGQGQEALELLNRLVRSAEESGRTGDLIHSQILQAAAFQHVGQSDQALETLNQALILAQPAGFVRLFVDQGPAMASLLSRLRVEGKGLGLKSVEFVEYIDLLLAAFGEDTRRLTPPIPQPLSEPLSPRELDVLFLLPSHLTGPEIARELFISVNTYKSHVKNIYSKLGVNGRAAAVQRAQELNLL